MQLAADFYKLLNVRVGKPRLFPAEHFHKVDDLLNFISGAVMNLAERVRHNVPGFFIILMQLVPQKII